MAKQTTYNAGIYVRLSKDDERAGESLSIENQKLILTKYVAEQGWNIVDIYVDDGYSGTSFDRPAVTRLLEDAKAGKINLIIVKDLSRFGRNYIQVGQYIDYIFPTYNIRFIALNDNVDTANKDTTAMDMLPIMNVFNEWHAANTSKKIKAVIEANCKSGKYRTTFAPYGYVKGDDENHLPVVDEPAASVVRRIFQMRSQGISPRHIADTLNNEGVPIASDYLYAKMGKSNPRRTSHLWCAERIRAMLNNPTYLGHLVQMRTTTVSYKNHKNVKKDPSEWIIVENTHEPLVSQEKWDKCREMEASVSQGKKTKTGFVAALSGLMFCADCGEKMRLGWNNTTNGSKKKPRKYVRHNFNCGRYNRHGKIACKSHYIKMKDMNALVLADIRSMAALVIEDESEARRQFLVHKEKQNAHQTEAEQRALSAEVKALEARLSAVKKDEHDVEEFIRRLKKYTDVQELTREIALELIEYITVDEYAADRPRDIHIYYKLLEKPLPHKKYLVVNKGEETA